MDNKSIPVPAGWWARRKFEFGFLKTKIFKLQMQQLLRRYKDPDKTGKRLLYALGTLLTFYTLLGALFLGYKRAYARFMEPQEEFPRLYDLPVIVKAAMVLGAVVAWGLLIAAVWFITTLDGREILAAKTTLVYLGINLVGTFAVLLAFQRWHNGIANLLLESNKHASARWAREDDLKAYRDVKGLYIGGGMATDDKIHALTVAGTRSGKGTNIIIPNILNVRHYNGSMVVVDVKGENAAICANALRKQGRKVVIINPYDVLPGCIKGKSTYNPLSILSDKNSPHLVDDISILAEMLVPIKPDDKNSFFTDNARNIIASLLLHMVTSDKVEEPTLALLWEWVRLPQAEFDLLWAEMADSNNRVHGNTIRKAAGEVLRMIASQETFASIMTNVLQATNFMKSTPIQDTLVSGFDPYSLAADGNTVVFITIPPDKLQTQSTFLRLLVVSMMRAVIRRPGKRVTFMVDECFSLSYISEFPLALAAYAGYNLSLWMIYQDLSQIRATYGELWESIVGNCQVRHYFGIHDNFTAEYVSTAIGNTTRTVYKKDIRGNISDIETIERALATPDEVKRLSKDNIILFIGEHPAARIPKLPYYKMPELKDGAGNNLYDPNPYIQDGK